MVIQLLFLGQHLLDSLPYMGAMLSWFVLRIQRLPLLEMPTRYVDNVVKCESN